MFKSITIDNGIEIRKNGFIRKYDQNIKIFRAEHVCLHFKGEQTKIETEWLEECFIKVLILIAISQVKLDDVVNANKWNANVKFMNWQKPIELFKLANDYSVQF
ncbi:hypothetical protein HYD58_03480 [Mycoplasmopsis bovis]|nr:hypothetical protein [Mycoplasmopsis bovis]QQH66165.1 hypothetical protein HYD58_03480 [Mycoplasmopsis bovis]